MKNPARFPGPGLGTLLKDIFLYMGPVSTSRSQKLHRSHKLHHARLYSASQDGITPDTLRRARRRLKVKAKAREGRARGGWLWGFAGMFEDVAEDVQQQQNRRTRKPPMKAIRSAPETGRGQDRIDLA